MGQHKHIENVYEQVFLPKTIFEVNNPKILKICEGE